MLSDINIPEFEQMMVNVKLEDVYINQLFDIYHQHLLANSDVCKKLARQGINRDVIDTYKIGYCDRKLHHYISCSDTAEGGGFRGTLQSLELIKPTGHELFRGCIVEPVLNNDDKVISACGIKHTCPSRPAPRIIQWFRYRNYTHPIQFQLMTWGEKYVH